MPSLFHVSGWSGVIASDPFTLRPGTQCAEGEGVYFSEGEPRFSAAEGSRDGVTGVVVIDVDGPRGWWRTKPGKARRFGKPRTWHTDGKAIECRVDRVEEDGGVAFLHCQWRFK